MAFSSISLQLLLLAALLCLSCGAKSELNVDPPPLLRPRITVSCSAATFARVGDYVELEGSFSPSEPGTYGSWTYVGAATSVDSFVSFDNSAGNRARFTSSRSGRYFFRYSASSSEGGFVRTALCNTAVYLEPDIELSCPTSLTAAPDSDLPMGVTARSRGGRPLTAQWNRGGSTSGTGLLPQPSNSIEAILRVGDQGEYLYDLVVSNDRGESESCTIRVFAHRNFHAHCPADIRLPVFQTADIGPIELTNGSGLPLRYLWAIESPSPGSSSSQLLSRDGLSTQLYLDVAGTWNVTFVAIVANTVVASCTVRVTSYFEEDVRVVLHWNPELNCPYCVNGGGQEPLLLMTQQTANGDGFPRPYVCSEAGCRCNLPMPGPRCEENLMDWPPLGPSNDPRKDVAAQATVLGIESINVRLAVPATEFGVGVIYRSSFQTSLTSYVNWPLDFYVRVYCRGRLQYESERILLDDVGPRDFDRMIWRMGNVRFNEDGTCTVNRRCAPGTSQDACIGRTSQIYNN